MNIFNTNGHHSMHLFRWVAVVAVVIGGIALLNSIVQPTAQPAAQPAPAHPASAPAPAAKPATSTAQPAGPILLPAQAPGGAMRGAHAQIALASAQAAAGPWIDLGDAVISAPTSSFSTIAPSALRAVAPSSGYVRMRWSGWIEAATGGTYTLALSVSGGPTQSASLTVDGMAQPIASAQRACGWMGMCSLPTSTAAGVVALAQGWHIVQVQIIAPVAAGAGEQAAYITIYARAPGSGTPAVLVPGWPTRGAQG
ncbi:MAG: hypothetical protein M0P72_09685 [Metallibacterium scheffleri]|jgi:hypothetical protein|uniref:hypothetical protein n=1 Tax=Metallibacterium scheffleri TaxID=993689 RepID=UPI0026EE378A|nr:hypothetical protein [Metallibacterium scheffleri]MCK9367401.1 hypothetical protein [Metallibacterium scheffleri]